MAADELTKALLLEEVCAPRAIAEALFASVNGRVPLLQALVDSGATSAEVLSRYLARSEAPFLRQVVPVPELVERLPDGLCSRLLAVPVRHDAITGTVDVAVADPADPHSASEIGFHLGTPVRTVRATVAAIEEALRRLRMSSRDHLSSAAVARFQEAARNAQRFEHEPPAHRRPRTLPPPEPHVAPPRRGGLVIEEDSAPPPPNPAPRRIRTPPWGTPVHMIGRHERPASVPPRGEYGSEIPIPLTRKTFLPRKANSGTQRPPALAAPANVALGEGYAFDTAGFRDVVEKTAARIDTAVPRGTASISDMTMGPLGSFIPRPPPLPGSRTPRTRSEAPGSLAAYTAQLPFPEMGGVLSALRNAGSRDEVLELVLTGARMVAVKVALFVVKKGGYLGWVSSPEFADRTALQSVLIPLEANSIFDRAVREDLYLGPVRYDEVHAPLLRIMKNPTRDVAAVPIRVSGKTAVIIVADELGDTMIGTRRLEELARAGGEAFARIVRTRR